MNRIIGDIFEPFDDSKFAYCKINKNIVTLNSK